MTTELNDILAGTKGWFLWNGPVLGRDWPAGVRRLMHQSGAQTIAIKTYDGSSGFSQPFTIPDIKAALEETGPAIVGAWGYHYGRDLPGEIAQVEHALHRLQADFVILNVEDPAIERNPNTAREWADGLSGLRERWPNASLYFCSHAQPRYHEQQPYWQAHEAGLVQQPMIYHTAMERSPGDAVAISIEQMEQYGLLTDDASGDLLPWSAAGAAYGSTSYPIFPGDVVAWGEAAVARGATSLIWWAADSAIDLPDILEAVRQASPPIGKEKDQHCE